MSDKIRIMHVTGTLNVGGVEELLRITAKYNLKNKYDLTFITCHSSDGFISQKIQEMGYKVCGLNVTQRIYDLRMIPKLIQIFRVYKPHIVHFYFKISFLGRIAAKMARVPVIICNEVDMDWEEYGVGPRYIAMIKRRMNFLADKLIASSIAVRNYWDKNASDKYLVIYEPCDLTKLPITCSSSNGSSYKNGEYPVLGVVSRIWPKKGHEDLIRAMPHIISAFPLTRLEILGTGPLMAKMKALTKSLGLEKAVKFRGFVEDLYPALSSLDVFVFPTLTEAFPISVMEAMAVGLPVAASDVGGIPEMVEHGKTGLLFSPKNPVSLADAVIKILSDYKKAKLMGERGRLKVNEEFSPELYIQKYDALYSELLEAKGIY